MTEICVLEIVVILITVVNLMKLTVKIIMNVPKTLVLMIKVVYILRLNVMIMMYVLSIHAAKKMDVNTLKYAVKIITNVRMIPAILLLDV
jgi:hypothetical protein